MAVTLEFEDALTTDRTDARNRRIEVITGRERRRRWTADQKREIAAESLQPGVLPAMVACKYGISSGLLYTWRQRLGDMVVDQRDARTTGVGLRGGTRAPQAFAALTSPRASLGSGAPPGSPIAFWNDEIVMLILRQMKPRPYCRATVSIAMPQSARFCATATATALCDFGCDQ